LSQQLSLMTKAYEDYRHESKDDLHRREEYYKDEISKLEKFNEGLNIRVQKLEQEKEKLLISRRDMDQLKAKNMELEDKIHRQDQYMKNRLLKDRTNSLHAPESSAKPVSSISKLSSSVPAPQLPSPSGVVYPPATTVASFSSNAPASASTSIHTNTSFQSISSALSGSGFNEAPPPRPSGIGSSIGINGRL
jgi:hypothetical protein